MLVRSRTMYSRLWKERKWPFDILVVTADQLIQAARATMAESRLFNWFYKIMIPPVHHIPLQNAIPKPLFSKLLTKYIYFVNNILLKFVNISIKSGISWINVKPSLLDMLLKSSTLSENNIQFEVWNKDYAFGINTKSNFIITQTMLEWYIGTAF